MRDGCINWWLDFLETAAVGDRFRCSLAEWQVGDLGVAFTD